MEHGKPVHRADCLNDELFTTIARYQAEYRGIVNYYRLALNLRDLSYLRWVMETSLAKTMANKLKVTVNQVFERFRKTLDTPQGAQRVIQVEASREEKKPLVAIWGGISLVRNVKATLNDTPYRVWGGRTELMTRLLADTCELCGSKDRITVHHIRALRDLRKWGRPEAPQWVQTMAARQRKTLVLCHTCHHELHRDGNAGDVKARRQRNRFLESRVR